MSWESVTRTMALNLPVKDKLELTRESKETGIQDVLDREIEPVAFYNLKNQKSQWSSSILSPKAQEPEQEKLEATAQESKFTLSYDFVLFRPSQNWLMPTHIRKGDQLYSVHQFKY